MGKKQDLRPVPKGLASAMAKASKHIDKRYVYGLPHYGLNVKMRINLVELGDTGQFEDSDIDVEENPHWLPLATFKDEPQFLAVSTQVPYPVAMWEHEDGKFYTVWETFDDFVSKVIVPAAAPSSANSTCPEARVAWPQSGTSTAGVNQRRP